MLPPFTARSDASSIFRTTLCATRKAARTLSASVLSRWDSDTSTNGSGMFMPALFTSISSCSSRLSSASNCFVSVTSETRTFARPPESTMFFWIASSSPRVLLTRSTSAPASARASDATAPRPRPAPVTSAIRPSRRKDAGREAMAYLPSSQPDQRLARHSGASGYRPAPCVPRIARWRRDANNTRR